MRSQISDLQFTNNL